MVLLTGYVKNESGQPVPFASVQLADEFFDSIPGQGTAANGAGYFSFWADPDTLPYYITATSVGYIAGAWPIERFQSGSVLTLKQNPITLDPVVVTSTGSKPFPYWLLAIPAVLILSDKKKANSIGSVTGTFSKLPKPVKYISYGVAAYAAWRLFNSFMAHKNPTKTPGELEAELPSLPPATFPDTQFSIWCDRLQQQFDGCDFSIALPGQLTESAKVLNNILKQLNNDADFAKLVIIYGVREYDNCGPFTGNFRGNLNQAVTDELASVEIPIINSTLQSRGIKYRF